VGLLKECGWGLRGVRDVDERLVPGHWVQVVARYGAQRPLIRPQARRWGDVWRPAGDGRQE
jgi:hypothetical protein